MLFIILAAIAVIYLLTLFTRSGRKLNANTTKIIRVFLFVLAPVLIALLVISQYNIYPRGYWVTKVIFWVVFLLIMILFGLGNKSSLSKVERIIYKFFFYLPLCFIPFLLIPFIGIGTALLFYTSFIGDKSFVLYSDEHIRIQQQYVTFMGPGPPLDVYVKEGLFCHRDTVLPLNYNDRKDSILVTRLNDSTYSLIHYSPDNWAVPAGFREFKFSVKSK
jgi:hypothetical protein